MAHAKNHDYHILPPSLHPLIGAVSAFATVFGGTMYMKGGSVFLMLAGLAGLIYTFTVWGIDMFAEAKNGEHSEAIRIGIRMGFIMFIISEVFFFVAWFWNFFKHALLPMQGEWPPAGIETFDPWHLPLINTLILLLSGCFVTWAHHAIAHDDDRASMVKGLIFAVLLGVLFTFFQAYEYSHATFGFSGNIYGGTFFMATGFHGFHVLVGTIFLLVCLVHAARGGFSKEQHVGFESAAWYWHFVDVVWIFLFVAVYIWGG